ncbi:deoxyguanosinetriphosphate triphosphohydrolase [Thermodesulforhabdus norvegica]|uniref:deoxyguanosinetriphosphate triphosphohydrolase n=1 Tax=Thermodesulforhabdus norvegica TaxID=39841 RepID=UPI003182FFB9
MFLRDFLEEREELFLHPRAQKARYTLGRLHAEEECPLRTCYQRDRDRIVHSKAFRRLKHKTQVFISPTGDHYRTRLTHTLEVSQIARTIGRALRLNEDLIEAISLGHDLGHTPFGHGGERVLNELMPGGFKHWEQSLRVVDVLEKGGRGLNLTHEVRDGILHHSKGRWGTIVSGRSRSPKTLEGQVVRVADIIAYLSHDLDDAMRAGMINENDVPEQIRKKLGNRHSERIHSLVADVIRASMECGLESIMLGDEMLHCVNELREFLFERVYESPFLRSEIDKARKVIEDLLNLLMKDDDLFVMEIGPIKPEVPRERQVCDYIAGMTDRYALELYKKLFLPKPWMKL